MTEATGFRDYFSNFSDSYAAARPTYPRELFEYVAGQVASRERAWDCATGNGQSAIGLAEFFSEVQATDASEQQIAHAIARDNVEYSVQLAEQTDFPDDYFDVVIVSQALHWFDPDRFAAEAARVLKPGCPIFAWVYGFFRVTPDIDAIIDECLKQPIDSLWKRGNRIAKGGYTKIELPFPRLEVPGFQMNCEWTLHELFAYIATWSALNRYIDQHGAGILDATRAKAASLWGDPECRRTVSMDFTVLGWRNDP